MKGVIAVLGVSLLEILLTTEAVGAQQGYP